MKIYNLFPLTVTTDIISIEEKERKILVDEIIKMTRTQKENQKSNYAWTGDTKGYEFLFFNELFKNYLKFQI